MLEKILTQALKSIKKYPKERVGFLTEQRNVSAAVSAGELPVCVCWGRRGGEEVYWRLFPVSKADVRKAPPPSVQRFFQ